MRHWEIDIYPDDDEDHSFGQYLMHLNKKDKAIILRTVDLLRELGPNIIGTEMDGSIHGDIRELRKGRHRILYGLYKDKYVLLVAFLKNSQKTPQKYLDMVDDRFSEYKKLATERTIK